MIKNAIDGTILGILCLCLKFVEITQTLVFRKAF